MRRRAWLMAAVVTAVACAGTDPGEERFLAVLSGQNEVPPVAGLSAATVNLAARGSRLDYSIIVQNITGVTDAGIFVGTAGQVGPLVADLYSAGTSGAIASGELVSGTLTASGLTALSLDSLKALMRSGGAYVNIMTVSQPNGEIRGQLHLN